MAKLSTILVILAIVVSVHAAAVWVKRAPKTVTVESQAVFCSFLPKTPGEEIGDSEDDAIPFCTQANPANAPGAKQFPTGFIKTAHFKKGTGFVQVTGTIDRTKYKLKKSDGGGQYDTNAPPGAVCKGFKKFVNLVEPDINRFCIRCCTDTSKCPTGRSTDGCESVIPGDYS
uniref:88 kDa immunoreactive mannoprotein mp88 n=1 Tax=Anthurium amnicola TaxID=1678845 RepID=A0A1D1Z429_9ARAE